MYNVKDINIKNFLAKQGIFQKQERTGYGMYLSPFRSETAPSFKVDYNKNLWYDFGWGEGGSIIDIAREYCQEVHYTTNGKPFFAIGFQSDAGGWELRNEYFKGSTSPKSPTIIGNSSLTCLLFEGFMDMLSYLTLKNAIRPTVDMVVLNSVHNLHRAEEFLKRHQAIHCFLDNDEAGKRAFAAVEKLGRETIDQSPLK